jgi:hypothetical protein
VTPDAIRAQHDITIASGHGYMDELRKLHRPVNLVVGEKKDEDRDSPPDTDFVGVMLK